tara:strand:+ start:876 stop:1451 length:576 start_codon:yes stop_codon:yes gene_type:complete
MRTKRRERRRARTSVRDARTADLLNQLTERGFKPSGFFDPRKREVVMFPGADESVLEHELIHSEQYGPLRALLNQGRVQDRDTRKASRRISRSIPQEEREMLAGEGFSPLKYMLDSPIEFEAIVRSGVRSPEAEQVDFSQGFDDVLKSLEALPRDKTNTNLRLLRSAMAEGNFDDREKDLFLKAIRSNLQS